MRKVALFAVEISLLAALALDAQAQFIPGNLAVLRLGDGAQTLASSGNSIYIDQYATNGSLVNSTAIPTNGATALILSGVASSEGGLNRAIDRTALAFSAYNTNFGSVSSSLSSTASANVPRGIATVDANGNYTLLQTNTVLFTGTNPRCAATDGTNDFWAADGVDGTIYLNPPDSTATIQSSIGNTRYIRIVNYNLYYTVQSTAPEGLYTLTSTPGGYTPAGLTTTPAGTNVVFLTGSGSQPSGFAMDDAGTVVYLADQRTNSNGGIQKWTNNGVGWSYVYTLSTGTTNSGAYAAVVDFSGATPVVYATTVEETSSNRLVCIVDTNAAAGATTLASAGYNQSFKGLDFTPDWRPLITTQPQSQFVTNGSAVVFSVAATSPFPFTYQWQTNGGSITGATDSSLNLASVASADQASYTVVLVGQYGSVTSAVATLTASATAVAPTFTLQPVSETNYVGDNVTFSAAASGTETLSYQWLSNTVALTGETNSTLFLPDVTTADAATYSLQVWNSGGTNTSQNAVLTILVYPPTIQTQPTNVSALVGSTVYFSVTPGGSPPFAYQWAFNGTNLNDGGDYVGSSSSSLTINISQPSDSGTYTVVVTNTAGAITSAPAILVASGFPQPSFVSYASIGGVYTQNFDSLPDPGATTVNTANPVTINSTTYSLANPFDFAFPALASSPGGFGLAGAMNGWYGLTGATMRAGASAGDQSAGGIISFGATDDSSTNRALGLLATSTTLETAFGLRIINNSSSTLNLITLSYNGELWRQQPAAKSLSFSYYVDATGTGGFSTNSVTAMDSLDVNFPTGTMVYGTNGPVMTNFLGVTNQSMADWPPGAALWLVWQMTNSAGNSQGLAIDNLSFSAATTYVPPAIVTQPVNQTNNSGNTAVFPVVGSSAFPITYQWLKNGADVTSGNAAGQTTASLTLASVSSSDQASYQVILTNQYGSVTSAVATLTVVAGLPQITLQPQSQTNYVGSNVAFTVQATGSTPLYYQWKFNSAAIVGATGSNLVFASLALTNQGTYSVVVSNSVGSTPSQNATLTVLPVLPTILAQPASQSAAAGSTIMLSVTATGFAPLSYQWMLGNAALSDNNNFIGSDTSALTIAGVSTNDVGSYTVTITNPAGSSNSHAAVVTITPGSSYVAYTNDGEVYAQNFDSLPDPGSSTVNTANPVTIASVTYSLGNPFDFAAAVQSTGSGGFGLSNTMSGWYGVAGTAMKAGASAGDQATGGVISFGPTTSDATNRSLGLLATGTTGPTAFGVKFFNQTSEILTQMNIGFTAELWRQQTTAKTISVFYFIDPTGTNGFSVTNQTGTLPSLAISFATGAQASGTGGPIATTSLSATQNLTNWPPGAALWLVWDMTSSTSSSQGLGIDDLTFSATGVANVPALLTITLSGGNVILSWPATTPGYLEFTAAGLAQSNWQPVSEQPVTAGSTKMVTVPLSDGDQFFRLKQGAY